MEENKKLVGETVYTGTVVWFRADPGFGYGFLSFDAGNCRYSFKKNDEGLSEIFAHYSDIDAGPGVFRTLKTGQIVKFKIGENNRGEPKAIEILTVKQNV